MLNSHWQYRGAFAYSPFQNENGCLEQVIQTRFVQSILQRFYQASYSLCTIFLKAVLFFFFRVLKLSWHLKPGKRSLNRQWEKRSQNSPQSLPYYGWVWKK